MTDIIVIGGGPAGMTAALYALRGGRSVTVLEKNGFGGQITYSPKVENYPGLPSVSGNEFADRLLDQILELGAETELEKAVRVEDLGTVKRVFTEDGNVFEGRAVILAAGVRHRLLGLPGETELIGNGISFCAVCDGDFYKGQTVAVAGGGNSALQEAILLAETCKEVVVLQDLPTLTGEKRLQETLAARDNVRIVTGAKLTELVEADGELRGVRYTRNGVREELTCAGLFVAIGLVPENGAFSGLAPLDSWGYIASDERCGTGRPGVYCAGDCRAKTVRQLTTATADGATAALAAMRYLDTI